MSINKIDDFCDLLEEYAFRLSGRKSMSDIIPFVSSEEKRQLKAEIDGLPVAVIFDGTSRLGEALTIILALRGSLKPYNLPASSTHATVSEVTDGRRGRKRAALSSFD